MENIWIALGVWSAAYVADYYATLYGAHLYQTYGKAFLAYEGSYELTPQFQSDIDRLRWISPLFLGLLLLSLILIPLLRFLSVDLLNLPQLFDLGIGGLILRQAAVLIRHVRNIFLYRSARRPGALSGHVVFSRWLSLQASAVEFLCFAALYLLGFGLSGSWFFLGGALACLLVSLQHWRLSRKDRRPEPPAAGAG